MKWINEVGLVRPASASFPFSYRQTDVVHQISPTTLAEMERGVGTHMATAIDVALGATLHLRPLDALQAFWTGLKRGSCQSTIVVTPAF